MSLWWVDCYVRIDAMLNGKPFILHPMEGSSAFINQPDHFEIQEILLVAGIMQAASAFPQYLIMAILAYDVTVTVFRSTFEPLLLLLIHD